MKFLRSILLTLAVVATALASQAITFGLSIENPEALRLFVGSNEVALHEGINIVSAPEYTNIEVKSVSPYVISRIVDENDQLQGGLTEGSWFKTIYTTDEGRTYKISVTDISKSRTATLTINVDDAAKVKATFDGSYLPIDLHDGENVLKFDPFLEQTLILQSAVYNYEFYEVRVNGIVDDGYYGTFFIPIKDGYKIDILANYPDEDCTITFKYSAEGQGFITLMTMDWQEVPFDGQSVTCKAGTTIEIYANNRYDFKGIYVNNVQQYWDTGMPYRIVAKHDTKVYIDASPYKELTVYVECTNPDHLKLYQGYTINLQRISLPDTSCVIKVPEDDPLLTWIMQPGCTMEAVLINGIEQDPNRDWANVTDGMMIEFVTSSTDNDLNFIYWMDTRKGLQYFTFENEDRLHFDTDIKAGYNRISTYSEGNPFTLAWYGQNVVSGMVFVNDVIQQPLYEGTTNYKLNLKTNDIVKLFIGEDPQYSIVDFDIEEGADPLILRDIIREVEGDSETVLTGTLFSITPAADLKVSVDGVSLEATEKGAYEFIADKDEINVKIESNGSSVFGLTSDTEETAIFNLQGIKVGLSSDKLPAGIYIRNGRKFVVK